jgi:hypothetical protein
MKKSLMLITITIFLSFLVFGVQVMAEPSVTLTNWGSEVNHGQCATDGKLGDKGVASKL